MARTNQQTQTSVLERLLDVQAQLNETFVAREDAVLVVLLAHLTASNYLLVGDPGTAKTAIARSFASHVTGANFFSTLLGRFTTPEKVFGALDIEAFKRGVYRHQTSGMLPEAHFAFLDEGFKCNDGAINELLTVLNERTFAGARTPLLTVGSATNWPELERRDEVVEALYDRFLLRCQVDDLVEDQQLSKMLGKVDAAESYEPRSTVSLDELLAVQAEVAAVTLSDAVRDLLAQTRNRVAYRKVGNANPDLQIRISSRRTGRLQQVLRASAWLAGRDEVTVEDFDVLRFGFWVERNDLEKVNEVLSKVDAEEVKRTVAVIDRGRSAAAQYQAASNPGPAMLRDAMEEVRKVSAEAREMFERPVYTKRGRDLVRSSMRGLKDDFSALKSAASAFGGGK